MLSRKNRSIYQKRKTQIFSAKISIYPVFRLIVFILRLVFYEFSNRVTEQNCHLPVIMLDPEPYQRQ